MAILVKANAIGFYECLRYPDEEFAIESKDQLGKWMDVVEAEVEAELEDLKPKPAKDLIEEIGASEDLDFLLEHKEDSRVTVRRAAEERMEELAAG